MIHLFCGYDRRETVGFHVFTHSVIERASRPVAIHALSARGMPVGTNEFTYSRFLVPFLRGFEGHAIFMDASDMLMLADLAELDALFDPAYAVQVVQHANYETRHKVKYQGTMMQCPNRDYARKNWASVMVFNCAHPHWQNFNPENLAAIAGLPLLQFAGGVEVGELPPQWNRLADEGHPIDDAKVLHWTAGIPGFPHYHDAPGAALWHAARAEMEETA